MRKLKIFILLAMLSTSATAADLKIAATVGDDAITTYDMINRTKLIILSSGMQPTKETFSKVAPQALQGIINDRLIMQEAAKMGVTIAPDQIASAKQSIENNNKMPAGSLDASLTDKKIPLSTLEDQIKSQIAMAQITQVKIRPLINISDEEVEDFVKTQSANEKTEEYFLNEIVLPVEAPEDEQKTLELAQHLYGQLKEGKDFAAIAREFSGAATAFTDGKVGWLPQKQIPKEILAEVAKNEIGVVSPPIRSIEGFFIVKATQKRELNSISDEDEIDLKHYEIPLAADAQAKNGKQIMQKLSSLIYDDDACNNPDLFSMRNGMGFKDYGTLKIMDLDPKVRAMIVDLPIGTFSEPVKTANAGLAFLVCEHVENIAPLIDDNKRDAARQALFARKIDLQTRKFMRDLKRNTNIEVRL